MRGEAPWICDNCGKKRESDTNHWFVIIAIIEPGNAPIATVLRIAKWDEECARHENAKHICGAACRNVLVERFFAFGNFDKPKNEPPPIPPPSTQPRGEPFRGI